MIEKWKSVKKNLLMLLLVMPVFIPATYYCF